MSLSVEDVNKLSSDQFIKLFGNVVEHYPSAAIGILKKRPFQEVNDISTSINNYLNLTTTNEKEKILGLHPDLAGRLLDSGNLTIESTEEQKSIGLNKISTECKRILTKHNEEYRNKFGFPFVICARQNDLTTILKAMESRLKNDKSEELIIGMEEVKKISKLRIFSIVKIE